MTTFIVGNFSVPIRCLKRLREITWLSFSTLWYFARTHLLKSQLVYDRELFNTIFWKETLIFFTVCQGKLEMWLDIFPKAATPDWPPIDITPRKAKGWVVNFSANGSCGQDSLNNYYRFIFKQTKYVCIYNKIDFGFARLNTKIYWVKISQWLKKIPTKKYWALSQYRNNQRVDGRRIEAIQNTISHRF